MSDVDLNVAVGQFDLPGYLMKYSVTLCSEREWILTCPTCGKQKLTVNMLKKAYHCWVCESMSLSGKGGLVALVQLLEDCTRYEAARKILKSVNPHVPLQTIKEDLVRANSATKTLVPIDPPPYWRYAHESPDGIMPYATKRGITLEDVRLFGLLWCDQGRYANRLVFPVWHEGALVYWQARAMWEESEHVGAGRYIKSLNPPRKEDSVGAGDVLFNLQQAKSYKRVCLTEGPIDAIHTGLDAVCSFGKKISPSQVGLLHKAGVRELDLMWDGPSRTEPQGAWPEMFRAAEMLRDQFVVRMIFLPRGDPGDYSRDDLTWLRMNKARAAVGGGRLEEIA